MSEADFFPVSAGQFRGSKYPGFVGGTTNQSGNVQPTGASANVSQASGNNQSPAQVQQGQVTQGNSSAQTGGTLGTPATTTPPSSALNKQSPSQTTLGGLAAQTVLPAAGDIAGSAIGGAIGSGSSLGGALNAGGDALGNAGKNLLNGNFSGLLGGSTGAGASAAGSSITSAGLADGLPAVNVGTPAVDQLGSNAISEGVGASSAGDAASIGGAGLSGVGTFAADLLSGKSLQESAISGAGAAAGAYIGSMILPGPGTVVGSFLGSMLGGLFGNHHPTVGPNGDTLLTVNDGQLGLGITGADNGADPSVTENAAKSSIEAINKILTENNLTIDPTKLTKFGDNYYNELSVTQGSVNSANPHSALDVWNNLMKANAIVSKTPNNEVPAAATNAVNTVSGSTAPVLQSGTIQ